MALDLNRPVQTRDGRKARILCSDLNDSAYPVVAAVSDPNGREWSAQYRANGRYTGGDDDTPADLINVPERLTGWVNLYPRASSHPLPVLLTSHAFATREEADLYAGTDRIGVAYIDTEKLP